MKLLVEFRSLLESSSFSVFELEESLDINFLPKFLPWRENQVKELAVLFKPLLFRHFDTINVVVKGPSGSGKSVTVKRFGEEFATYARERGIRLFFTHLNARKHKTLYLMLSEVAKQLNANIPNRGLSTQEMFKKVYEHLERKNAHLIFAIDEFDYFARANPIDDVTFLTRYYDELRYDTKRVSFIFLLKDLSPVVEVKDQITSVIDFLPYTSRELFDILIDRVKNEKAFKEGAVEEEAVRLIADTYGIDKNGSGNARLAIETLRLAGKIADAEEAPIVAVDHAKRAVAKISPELSIVGEAVKVLQLHELLLLKTVINLQKENSINMFPIGVVEERYSSAAKEIGEEPRKHTQVYEYVMRMKLLGVVHASQSGRGTRGRTTIVSLAFSPTPEIERMIELRIKDARAGS